jgi:FtsP/CotA-like multicopper oxidase with cupredoxin domain/fibronectin type 3 domain-containing protein
MAKRKFLSYGLLLLVIVSFIFGGASKIQPVSALPISAVDETKVPHYFGPYPNWANSPFTLPDVSVSITDPGGKGTGATAVATVGANGTVTSLTITNPGKGYTAADVAINGAGSGATATASVTLSGMVTGITVDFPGAGYSSPVVAITGGGASTDATATAYGGVDAVLVSDVGFGYSFPTVDFDLPDDPNGVQASGHVVCVELNCAPVAPATTVTISSVIVDNPGSGYSTAPNVIIRDGTLFDPINHDLGTFGAASAASTLSVSAVTVNTYGAGYTSTPTVDITDLTGTGSGALASASTDVGGVTSINLTAGGSGYVTAGGIKKFTDPLPGLCNPPGCPSYLIDPTAKYIPLGVPEVKTYNGVEADEYVIGLVQYRTSFSSSLKDPVTGLPVGTLVRGYVQLETPSWLAAHPGVSQSFPLTNELLDGSKVPVMQSDGITQWLGVTPPQYLGPTLIASRDRAVRIVFYNLLPIGSGGDLFLPTDSSLMGSGTIPESMLNPMDQGSVLDGVRNPLCSEYPKDGMNCFKDNRATLHLHGGVTPWISDGTPHQWITPAGEDTLWPEGVSVKNVPDMDVCGANNDGCQTFYYTNQQSARLMFYHDHAWGITRLNVYAGEAAGYVITDATEQALFGPSGTFAALGEGIPLVIQDRTFVPDTAQLAAQDPTWDTARWGGYGNFWYHHVYMPAQNPGDPSGMSAYGRWMYGPWFWPPAANTVHGPIDNPYYNMDPATGFMTPLAKPCNIDDPTTWQYQTDPFCEPQQIPGTPNISVGMEQFNDTPIVNGVAYPTLTLEPKSYRLRILSAANDRFFNFQWYVADPSTASTGLNNLGQVIGGTEVALNQAELAGAQLDPNIFPTPDTSVSLPGPDWIQIGTEGGFLPAPVVVDGQQPTTWIIDPTRFDVGNVDKHSLLLAPAERADVIVDFSQFAGQTLILYNDAPAAFPARVSSYDYYTGAPDLSPVGAPTILPGYGPNTRTILQVKIAGSPAPAFNLNALKTAFKHHADGSGVFEKGQHPIIVGQAAYNSAYGTSFAASSNCNVPGSPLSRCDGLVRVSDTSVFGFNTLRGQSTRMVMPLQPKAIHDEMNASTFDEFGRMQANLGVEAQPPVPGAQNVVLYPYVNPSTELIDATGLPKGDINVTPISSATDGTQIWRITHNGVDTHPIHFHLYDVQLLNRVTWDNIIIPLDATELGWKDTVRISPLEDTIVALRPIIPTVPFELPNSIRELNPMMPDGSTIGFNAIDPQGNPTNPVVNQLVNFGWEYVYHCHILSHEEMDMMRPVSVALPPNLPDGLVFDKPSHTLAWNDNSVNETSFVVQRSTDGGVNWVDIGTSPSPLNQSNAHSTRTFVDPAYDPYTDYQYRVVAKNSVGYGAEFPSMTVQSISTKVIVLNPPKAPSNLAATLSFGPVITLNWQNNATNQTGFSIERSVNGGVFSVIGTVAANVFTFTDNTGAPATTYAYRVAATNAQGSSLYSNTVQVVVPAPPAAPTNLTVTLLSGPRVSLTFRDNANNETGFIIQRAIDGGAFTDFITLPAKNGNGNVTYMDTTVTLNHTYAYKVTAVNAFVRSAYTNTASLLVDLPSAPVILSVTTVRQGNNERVTVTWSMSTPAVTGYTVQWSATNWGAVAGSGNVGPTIFTFTTGNIARQNWYFRVVATNPVGTTPSAAVLVTAAP